MIYSLIEASWQMDFSSRNHYPQTRLLRLSSPSSHLQLEVEIFAPINRLNFQIYQTYLHIFK